MAELLWAPRPRGRIVGGGFGPRTSSRGSESDSESWRRCFFLRLCSEDVSCCGERRLLSPLRDGFALCRVGDLDLDLSFECSRTSVLKFTLAGLPAFCLSSSSIQARSSSLPSYEPLLRYPSLLSSLRSTLPRSRLSHRGTIHRLPGRPSFLRSGLAGLRARGFCRLCCCRAPTKPRMRARDSSSSFRRRDVLWLSASLTMLRRNLVLGFGALPLGLLNNDPSPPARYRFESFLAASFLKMSAT